MGFAGLTLTLEDMSAAGEQARALADKHPILIYTIARIGLLVLVGVPLYLAGARGYLLLIAAFLISGLLSFILLNGPRSGFSRKLAGVFQRMNDRIDSSARAEDDDDDAVVADLADQAQAKAEPNAGQQ